MAVKVNGDKYEENNLIGTEEIEVIKGGTINDTIQGGLGADTITGGTGANLIEYSKGDGNDVINLTKGENFTLSLLNIDNLNDIKFEFVKNDLRIYTDSAKTTSEDEYITIKNFVSKDVTNNGNAKKGIDDTSSVELLLKDSATPINLREINIIDGYPLYYQEINKNYTGSWLSEGIDAEDYKKYDKKGILIEDTTQKGLSINGKDGFNMIVGSNYSDTIKGGKDVDSIEGGLGNDKITAGLGTNNVVYSKGDGNDIITLTKGENFTLSLEDISNIKDIAFEIVKKDLRIYTSENEYITLKNFAGKDVTNNGNAKKGIEDTSSVELLLKDAEKPIDLREYLFTVDNLTKNYTGSWLNEQIKADEYRRYTDKKKTIVDTDVTKKGLSLNGKDGNDLIGGSDYSDTIKGGNGDDTIEGGTGNDKLYGEAGKNTLVFEVGHGNDTVYAGKGEDTIVFDGVDYINSIEQVKKGSKDAVISYGDKDDTVTIKNFYTIDKKGNVTGTNSSVKCIKTNYQQICISSKADDVFELTEYGDGFEDRLHTTILTGANSSDALVLNDESFAGDDGNFVFKKDGDDFKIWYNYDTSILSASVESGVTEYNGSQINNTGGLVYTSSITIKDYFTAENPIDKFIINGNEYSIYENYENYIYADDYNFETATRNEVHGTRWKDYIKGRKGTSGTYGDSLYGGVGNDTIESGGWVDSVYGEDGKDFIRINPATMLADGGNGNDTIGYIDYHWGPENTNGVRIIGGTGNDSLSGNLNHEVKSIFEFKMGDGQDTVVSNSEIDIIKITDCEHSAITYEKDGDNILIKYGESDVITVEDALKNLAKIMIEDQNGNQVNMAEQLNIYIGDGIVTGSDGNDTLYGRDNVDTITGKKGDDLLVGQKGSDTYEFNTGDGIDTIVNGNNTEIDSIKFNDITDVRNLEFNIANNEKDLVISYGENDKVIVQNYFEYGNTVKKFKVFDNDLKDYVEYDIATDNNHSIDDAYSASVTGTIFNDYIKVNALNKSIAGGEGANTYVITADNVARTITTTSGRDTIKFTGINLSALTFDKKGSDVTIKGTGVNITLKNYFVNIPELLVSDGTTTAKVVEQLASAGIIYSDDETVLGTDNSEEIFGGDSNNTLIGKKGNDILNAGKGNDTYQFTKGDGYDSVINGTEANEVDTIFFTDSELSELTYSKSGNDLIINYSNSDSVTIKNYYTENNTVKKFKVFDYDLSDYVEYDIEKDLKNNIHATTTTVSDTEKNDRIWGTAGDDTITATKGVNELIGGNGADTYNIGIYGKGFDDRVHNTIVMGADNVIDTIKMDQADYHNGISYFIFEKEGDNLRLWYNYDKSISTDGMTSGEVNIYQGSEVFLDGNVYCSSLTIKDYFKSTAENCTIDKLVINGIEYSIYEEYENKIYANDYNFETATRNEVHGTRWNDYIEGRRGTNDTYGDSLYGGDGNDTIESGGWADSVYGGNGNDSIRINPATLLADGGNGNDTIGYINYHWGPENTNGVTIIGGKGDDVITGNHNHDVNSIYQFSIGDGNDTINYKGDEDIIKFNDVEITDITFGEYDLETQTVTLSYGTSDTLTINGLSTDRNTVKIEDSTGTQYTVFVGDGNQTTLKPNAGENVVFINSTGRDSFMGNTGVNIFTDCSNTYDGITGSETGTNIFLIRPEKDTGMYAWGQNDKIILKDLELSDLVYDFDNSYGYVYITNTKNSQKIQLQSFASFGVNPTIVDKNGDTTTILDELPIIFPTGETLDGTEGTNGDDILIGSGNPSFVDKIVGGKGNDTLYGSYGADTYEFNKGDGNDLIPSNCGQKAILKFNDSTYEELDFAQVSGTQYKVTYNGGADSVIFNTEKFDKFIVKDGENYKEYSIATDMAHKVIGDGIETNLMGSDIKDIFTGTAINETMTGGKGSNIYNFTTGSGTDTVVISTNTDTINFTDVKTDDLTFSLNGDDLEIAYGTGSDKVIVKDYAKTLPEVAITGADSTSTTAMDGFATTGATLVNGIGTGTDNADILIAGATDDTITGGKGDDTISGGTGNNTYIFNKGDGTDTINYTNGNDIIKFNDVEITDITFGEYDLENKTVTLSYGTSDTLTINGLSTDRNTVKFEDSTGTQYTVFVGDGNQTTLKPNAGENVVFINSTDRDSFMGNTGVNIFTDCSNTYDGITGSETGTNIFLIRPEKDTGMYAWGQNDKIILKDLELSDLVYDFDNSNGYVYITNTKNSQKIQLQNFASFGVNPTIVDKNGDTTTVCEAAGIILGDVGTSGDDIIISKTVGTNVYGKGGSDFISASANNTTIYTYDKDLKNTTAGSSVTVKTSNNYTYTIYAQSEENIILNQSYLAKGTYYAYSDQKTSITENNDQTKSTDSVLNIMNTDNVNDVDGVHTNLNIVFNVSNGYKTTQGIYAIGDVRILDDNNFANWVNGASYKDNVTIVGNCVETINSSDGYSITSEQIAQIAENVASWLTTNEFANVNEAMSGGTTEQIAELTAYFTNASNWTAMP